MRTKNKMNSLQKKAIEEARNLTEKTRVQISCAQHQKDESKRIQAEQDAYDTVGQCQRWLTTVLESEAS